MIAPSGTWVRFEDDKSKLDFMKKHNLISESSVFPKTLVYAGGFTKGPILCSLLGFTDEKCCVIDLGGSLHCIHTDYLAEMQAGKSNASLPEKYVVLDLETTGTNHYIDSIIEIAAVKYAGASEESSFVSFVNPRFPIPEIIETITGINNSDIENAPFIEEVIPKLISFIQDYPIVAHNAPFDKSFLVDAYRSCGFHFKNKIIDTLTLARKAFPQLESHRLEYLKEVLNLSEVASHRALPDVYNTAELLIKCSMQLASGVNKVESSNKKRYVEKERKYPIEMISTNGPLFEKNIVFTGELSFDRNIAIEMAAKAGAVVKKVFQKRLIIWSLVSKI